MRAHIVVLTLVLGGCGGAVELESDATESTQAALSRNDALRFQWARYVRDTIAPRLRELGVRDVYIKRATWWGLREGIFTLAGNPEYGQPGGRQSPLSHSNCRDRRSINSYTAFPDCVALGGYFSGGWQVGIAGIQVSDFMGALPAAYRKIYGDVPAQLIGQRLLGTVGEAWRTFPALSVEQLSTRGNARWAAVLMRDPFVNVYLMTTHSWIRDGRNLGYGRGIVEQVWAGG